MSYILDALKKLEQEKTRKSRSGGKINISGELFANERVRPVAGRRLKTIILVSVAVVATFIVTWFALKGSGKRNLSPVVATAVRPNPVASIPVPVPTIPATPPVTQPPLPQAPAAIPPRTAAIPVLPAAPVRARQAARSSSPDDEEEVRESPRHVSVKSATSQTATVVAPKLVPAPADIKVSGIAWQDERSARRAVVNGFLMREGAVVAGAKITEIHQDRVKFTLSGTVFEVSLISAGSPAVGK
jgi:general secretion pathway protein B